MTRRTPEEVRIATANLFVLRRHTWKFTNRLDALAPSQRPRTFDKFVTRAAAALARRDLAYVTELVSGPRVIASALVLGKRSPLCFLKTYDAEFSGYGPGNLLDHMTIMNSFDQGARGFDWGLGDEPYKYRLGATDSWSRNIIVE